MLWKSIKVVSLNNFVISPLVVLLNFHMSDWKVEFTKDMESLPDTLTVIMTVIFCLVVEDLAFHLGHRLMHWRRLYPYIHKLHH